MTDLNAWDDKVPDPYEPPTLPYPFQVPLRTPPKPKGTANGTVVYPDGPEVKTEGRVREASVSQMVILLTVSLRI